MKYCQVCGKPMEDDAVFCTGCGTRTDEGAQQMKAPGSQPQADGAAAQNAGQQQYSGGQSYGGDQYGGQAHGSDQYGGGQAHGSDQYGAGHGYGGAGYGRQGIPSPAAYYDHTAEFSAQDISDNKVIAMLVYLMGTVGIIIALLARDSRYAGFHVRQALKLTVLETVVWVCAGVLGGIFGFFGLLGSIGSITRYGGGIGSLIGTSMLSFLPIILAAILSMVLVVVRIICFISICKGKAVEAPIARSFGFMR